MPPNPLNMNWRCKENLNDCIIGQIFVYSKPIDLGTRRYQRSLFPDALPNRMQPSEFFAIPTWFPENVEEAVELCVNATVSLLTKWIIRREKDSLRPDRKKPWSAKYTRDPINDDAREKAGEEGIIETFRNLLSLAKKYESIKPMETSKFGPAPQYDRVAVAVIFVVKESYPSIGFETLRQILMKHNVDLRTSKKAKNMIPSATRLKELYRDRNIREWMRGFLKWLNDSIAQPIVKHFGVEEMEYVIDGTKVTTRYLDVAVIGLKKALKRKTFTVKFLVDIITDMPVDVIVSESRQVTEFIEAVPENSTVYGDSEFFTEKNCEKALARRIDFQVKPRAGARRGSAAKEVRSRFDPRRYGRRKNGERAAKPYSDDSRLKTRFKDRKAWETLAISIALAKAYKRLRVLKARKKLFKKVPIKPKKSAK